MVQSAISYIRSIAFGVGDQAAAPPTDDGIPAYKKGSRDDDGQYEPSPVDVFIVREMLVNFTKLPVEVVEAILDMAEYWPHSEASVAVGSGIEDENVVSGGGYRTEDIFLMRTYPIGMLDSHGGNLQVHGSSAQPQSAALKTAQPGEYVYERQPGQPDTRYPLFGRRMRLGRPLIAQPINDDPPPPEFTPTPQPGLNPHSISSHSTGPISKRMRIPVPPIADFNWVDSTSVPAESQPAEHNPAEHNPAESNPAESNPAESNPAESNPAESNSADAEQQQPETEPESVPQDVDQSKSAAYSQDSFEAPDPELFAKLANYPIPALVSPVRKIVFKIRSHDQGWMSMEKNQQLPFHGSWTWFEAGMEKLDKKDAVSSGSDGKEALDIKAEALRCVIPGPKMEDGERVYNHVIEPDKKMLIQKNKAATRQWQDHEIVWRCTDNVDPESDEGIALETAGRGKASASGEFVRSLEVGDVVTIWAKARFNAWTNYVENASVKVYWAL